MNGGILGSKHTPKIITDHQPLQWLIKQKTLNPRVIRWVEFIQLFLPDMSYCLGKENTAGGGLSQRSDHDDGVAVRAEQRTVAIKVSLRLTYSNELKVTGIRDEIKSAY